MSTDIFTAHIQMSADIFTAHIHTYIHGTSRYTPFDELHDARYAHAGVHVEATPSDGIDESVRGLGLQGCVCKDVCVCGAINE
jgi:hypothetical protein